MAIHSATVQSYGGAERGQFRMGPWSYSHRTNCNVNVAHFDYDVAVSLSRVI